MRFAPSQENLAFAASLHDLLSGASTTAAARAWAAGDHSPGRTIWSALADLGVTGLAIDEGYDGVGGDPADLAIALEALGYHGVPGPVVESIAVLPALLTGEQAARHLPALAGGAIGTVAIAPRAAHLLDADASDLRFTVAADGRVAESVAPEGAHQRSIDPTRRLFVTSEPGAGSPGDRDRALLLGTFGVAAQTLGAGRRLLDEAVGYAKTRAQYGHLIGEYQAIKHLLADVATRLELAAPLVRGAAVALSHSGSPGVGMDAARDVSAARVASADAANLAARTALQVHGAIGYTAEHDLGIWLTKVRALRSAWGTQSEHRAVVLNAVRARAGAR
ncbi:Acyl-CoA dehydrogenase domain protein OS=Tsukamurella paurometabola (strain ATCC 8368 / DSM/ CCUG 35730 / CIP 100753 / JCM 10117 / KCTC 9821 / NBRC 16120/ NCIMB 702349 / NCTC 13040) OX=521096 GN=Tpau_3839 PE=3 SV=1 [Tsukamurella paurometabola]|uniref:Acyl-CoA dehydrogenase domain protein n=1 Tax=Tsukamurella paurometabola (strain ATCC 8368 / DSM 20162 / CCUG 35730 / CIP 100753 / JCM 10117 / KCTC 9821 / NBRC 16120 / NCIMB 702349 / NCTC 13040) TaxID=521096 RepID=D5UYW1_TSUPD|nr:acyl-CoA dehydrogenase family protein [Tsukamurella paurometabola]ADG80414.1 acyl-CoA dehydrogenase domain protein [Tsukamurella paurometabola DSM 20162]SUP39548.1 Acyl-CoA dehydrogenase, short-chain specific [Tsukamurella paurometabola]